MSAWHLRTHHRAPNIPGIHRVTLRGALPGYLQWLHAEEASWGHLSEEREKRHRITTWGLDRCEPQSGCTARCSLHRQLRPEAYTDPIRPWGVDLRVTSAVWKAVAQHDSRDLSRSSKRPRESRQVGTTEQCLASNSSGGGWLRGPQSSSELLRRKEETRSRQCLSNTPGAFVLLGRGLVLLFYRRKRLECISD